MEKICQLLFFAKVIFQNNENFTLAYLGYKCGFVEIFLTFVKSTLIQKF
jgi:hypothetical protein